MGSPVNGTNYKQEAYHLNQSIIISKVLMEEKLMTDWKKGKEQHLALSSAAADMYDELYEHANFATGSYMRYELEMIGKYITQAPSLSLAIDLGCGTGRDSFLLSRHFDQVYGYDFSPEMIRVATKNKLHKRVGNALFEVLDVEEESLPLSENTVAFVNTGFGMASFIANPEKVFREIRRVLQPRGIAIFSFYNADALVNNLDLQWRPALAARVVEGKDALSVDFDGKIYEIAAKAYKLKEIKRRLEGNFIVKEITTFPTLSALFPQTLFQDVRTRELCTRVDQLLASNLDIAAGPYIVAVCQKGGTPEKVRPVMGYARVLELLRFHDITLEIREHRPVRNMSDVKEVLDASPSEMVKSILIAVDTPEESSLTDNLNAQLFMVGIPADRKLDVGKLAKVIDKRRELLRFATQVELEELTGFQVGSIPPFGLPKNIPVILDTYLASLKKVWCGTGRSTESLRLSMEDLKKLSAFTIADVSKPES